MNSARLPRILGAIVYDLVIVAAILFVVTLWSVLVPDTIRENILYTAFMQIYIIGVSFLYFAISWRRGGQTIGMKSWRIRLLNQDQNTAIVSWRQCLIRFLVALLPWILIGYSVVWLFNALQIRPGWNLGTTWLLFGLMYLMTAYSSDRGSPHDRFSKTRIFSVPKESRESFKAEGE